MISPLAYVDSKAVIGNNVTIHPFAYIDKDVVIGDNCVIYPYASVLAGTVMGKNNRVFQGAILGAEPQDFHYKGDATRLSIGDDNMIREYVIINRATTPEGETVIGNRICLLKGTRIGHDCRVDDDCILGIDCDLSGECHIHSKAILAGRVIVKERCRVGSWTLVKSGCRTGKDIPPYILAAHNPITYKGINAFILDGEDSVRLLSRISLWLIDRYISRVLVLKMQCFVLKKWWSQVPKLIIFYLL